MHLEQNQKPLKAPSKIIKMIKEKKCRECIDSSKKGNN